MAARYCSKRLPIPVALCTVVVTAIIASMQRPLRERYFLHHIGSQDPEVRSAAIRALGDMRSERAVPSLIEAIRTTQEERPAPRSAQESRDGVFRLTPAAHALHRIGVAGLALIAQAEEFRLVVNVVGGESGPGAASLEPGVLRVGLLLADVADAIRDSKADVTRVDHVEPLAVGSCSR